MSINSINGVNGTNQLNRTQRVDQKELDVAQKLADARICTVQEFLSLDENGKKAKVEEYNKTHPDDPIADKNKQNNATLPPEALTVQDAYGSELKKFFNDVDLKKLKLT